MNRLLNRLERKYGRYAPTGLTQLLVFGMGLGNLLEDAFDATTRACWTCWSSTRAPSRAGRSGAS